MSMEELLGNWRHWKIENTTFNAGLSLSLPKSTYHQAVLTLPSLSDNYEAYKEARRMTRNVQNLARERRDQFLDMLKQVDVAGMGPRDALSPLAKRLHPASSSPRLANQLSCLFAVRDSCFLAGCFYVFPSKHLFSLEASRYAMLGFVSPWICVYELRCTVEMLTVSSRWTASSLGPRGNILSSLNGLTRLCPPCGSSQQFPPST